MPDAAPPSAAAPSVPTPSAPTPSVPTPGVPTIPFAELLETGGTGDLLIFQGKSPLDYMIQLEEHAPYNHVGMLVRRPDGLFFWDAPGGGPGYPDPYRGNASHPGTRVAPLPALFRDYMADEVACFYRALSPALSDAQRAALDLFIDAVDGFPFPGDGWKLPDELNLGIGIQASYFLGRHHHLTKAGSYFCAQLVADTYMHMGLLPPAPRPANGYSPADFGATDGSLPLVRATLGPVTQVLRPPVAAEAATLPHATAPEAVAAAVPAPPTGAAG